MTRGLGRFLRRNTIALLALFLALGGTSYAAATLISGSQIKPHTIAKNRLTNKAIKQLRGNRGPRGLQGPAGQRGPTGAQGARGATGPAGPFTNTLPSGMTVRGVFYMLGAPGANNYNGDSISFGFQLAAVPTGRYIASGTTPPAECPGTYAAPEAAAGNLCVYEGGTGNTTASRGLDRLTKTGSGVFSQVAAAGHSFTYGSWAVTAP